MEEELTIQQVAALTGLSGHTLRYYEREGLLDPVSRSSNGHRRYSAADLAWIDFLNRLRTMGMPIRHMKQYAELRRQGERSVSARCALLKAHQQAVREHIDALQQNLAVLEAKIRYYEELEAEQHGESAGTDPLRKRADETGGD